MKARTRAQKLSAKRGARLLPGDAALREPNGRKSRRKAARQERGRVMDAMVMNTALSKRIRDFGLRDRVIDGELETAEKQARNPLLGYELGRLFVAGKINGRQHDIGITMAKEMARYYGLCGIPFPSPRSGHLFATKPEEEPDTVPSVRVAQTQDEISERARSARDKKVALTKALLAVGDINTGRKVHNLLMSVVVEDRPMKANTPNVDLLVRGLNAVGKFYGA